MVSFNPIKIAKNQARTVFRTGFTGALRRNHNQLLKLGKRTLKQARKNGVGKALKGASKGSLKILAGRDINDKVSTRKLLGRAAKNIGHRVTKDIRLTLNGPGSKSAFYEIEGAKNRPSAPTPASAPGRRPVKRPKRPPPKRGIPKRGHPRPPDRRRKRKKR